MTICRLINGILFLLDALIILGCDARVSVESYKDLVEYFNGKGRYPRFENSELIFGDTINAEKRRILKFDSIGNAVRIYRKAAYRSKDDPDAIVYFMYGLSKEDAILNEVRIRSFKRDTLIGDYLIINLDKDRSIIYDYWFEEPTLIVEARNTSKATHYSYFRFHEGQIVNTTFVPDTLFRRTDLVPELGSMVRIYDDFGDKLLRIGDQEINVRGKIIQRFRGEDCRDHMIVELIDSLLGYKFLLVDYQLNATTSVSGLQNDRLIEGREACLKTSGKPESEAEKIKEKAYIDYE
jgi:hypothetical protein